MCKGDYVVCFDIAWQVLKEHIDGTIQIKCLNPSGSWVDNMQVRPNQCTPITKEVADIMRAV